MKLVNLALILIVGVSCNTNEHKYYTKHGIDMNSLQTINMQVFDSSFFKTLKIDTTHNISEEVLRKELCSARIHNTPNTDYVYYGLGKLVLGKEEEGVLLLSTLDQNRGYDGTIQEIYLLKMHPSKKLILLAKEQFVFGRSDLLYSNLINDTLIKFNHITQLFYPSNDSMSQIITIDTLSINDFSRNGGISCN